MSFDNKLGLEKIMALMQFTMPLLSTNYSHGDEAWVVIR
jgi:hypothetical protein